MEVIILGSGDNHLTPKRHSPGYLLKIGKENLVFDFGRGTIEQLLKLKIIYKDVDRIFITHPHVDHFSDLIPYFFYLFNPPLESEKRTRDIYLYGPKGFQKIIEGLTKLFPSFDPKKAPFKFSIRELNNSKIKGKNWQISSFVVSHCLEFHSLAYRIESNKKILTYSGDTKDCKEIREVAKDADLAILEATWPDELKSTTHLTASRAGRIAQKARVKKLVLTHFSPYYEKNFNIKKEAQKYFKGPIILAKDLMRIKL